MLTNLRSGHVDDCMAPQKVVVEKGIKEAIFEFQCSTRVSEIRLAGYSQPLVYHFLAKSPDSVNVGAEHS